MANTTRRKNKGTDAELDKFKNWVENLKNASENHIILVEGKSDKEALASFGIKSSAIVYLKGPLYSVVESIAKKSKECILLMDLDAEGRKLQERLLTDLQANGVKVNTRFTKLLYTTKIRNIEAIPKYIEKHLTITPRKRPSFL
ncbi:MAG: toprim domain-containing protein [Candidatus Nanoarchaeia archaeon]|nr:toprim domain-containing protein [Candidatus Nanoarchaeia archaeon]